MAAVQEASTVRALAQRIAELEALVRQREEQLAIVAHDLRGPLSPLILMVHRLADELQGAGAPPRDVRARVDAIRSRLDQFVVRLNDLLDATRLQTAAVELDPQELDLVEVTCLVCTDMVEGMHRPPPISIQGVSHLHGWWDRPRIEQIVRNLLDNALRFGGGQPIEVTLEVSEDDEQAILVVRDHGRGIAPQDHARIFEKHVRVGSKGFGLGLWIVRELVRAMRGRVELASEIGAGAAFTVTLPRGR